MSAPLFLHVMSDGKLYYTTDVNYTPTGTITGTFRILSDAKTQLLGTLSGTISSSLAVTGKTGKYGTEIT